MDQQAYWATPVDVEPIDLEVDPCGLGDDALLSWWIIGRWLGDGYIAFDSRKSVREDPSRKARSIAITCGHHERYTLSEVLRASGVNWKMEIARTATTFRLYDTKAAQWLVGHFGHKSDGKHIPGWALGLSRSRREALLSGYLSADGHEEANGDVSVASVSKKLAMSARLLAEGLGYRARLTRHTQATTHIEGRQIRSMQDIWTVSWRNSQPGIRWSTKDTFEDRGHSWSRVKSVTPELPQMLYNIGVEEDHSYVAEGIVVKNCFAFYNGILRYWIVPEDFYIGAGTIEVGDPLEIVVGTQISRSPVNWRLSNGLVRVTPAESGRVAISHYNGSSWSTAKEFEFSGVEPAAIPSPDAGRINAFTNLTILRNSPEVVSIRLSCDVEFGITWGTVYLDITLRRGDRVAKFQVSSYRVERWKVRPRVAEAATLLTGGLRAAAVTTSDRYVIVYGSQAVTTNAATGEVFATTNSLAADFGIGSEIGGTSAGGAGAAQALINLYFAGQSELLLVVTR